MGLTVRGQTTGDLRVIPQKVDEGRFVRSARYWGQEYRWFYHRLHRNGVEQRALDTWLDENDHLAGTLVIGEGRTWNDQYWRRHARARVLSGRNYRYTEKMREIRELAIKLASGKTPDLATAMRTAWYEEKMAQYPPDRRPTKEAA